MKCLYEKFFIHNIQSSGAGVPNGKPKNAAVAPDGKNRRALGDIGNVVAARVAAYEGKPLPQISRPITRYCDDQSLLILIWTS